MIIFIIWKNNLILNTRRNLSATTNANKLNKKQRYSTETNRSQTSLICCLSVEASNQSTHKAVSKPLWFIRKDITG